jgi:VRR-NUC domain
MSITPLADLSEKEWQAQVVALAKQTGWKGAYHTFDSRRSTSGFPDLVLVRERVVYIELKSQNGYLSKAQAQWILWLLEAAAEVVIARPHDLALLGQLLGPRSGHMLATIAFRERAETEAMKRA